MCSEVETTLAQSGKTINVFIQYDIDKLLPSSIFASSECSCLEYEVSLLNGLFIDQQFLNLRLYFTVFDMTRKFKHFHPPFTSQYLSNGSLSPNTLSENLLILRLVYEYLSLSALLLSPSPHCTLQLGDE